MNKKKLSYIIIGILLLSIGFSSINKETFSLERRGQNLIRFHVLANSDSPEDQQLKLKVRDKVIAYVSGILEGLENVDETREALLNNMDNIQAIARQEIIDNGFDFNVAVNLGEHVFPTKRYGNVIFPAGNYEALRVIIGDGYGQNWWCVMFPPLCFVDVKHGLTDEKTKEYLKEALSEEEYDTIYTNSDNQQFPLQLRSKVFEVIKESRVKLDEKLAWLF